MEIVQADEAVHRANGALTVHIGPTQIVVGLSTEFEDQLTTPQIEACVERLETKLRAAMPEITGVFIKPQTAGTWEKRAEAITAND